MSVIYEATTFVDGRTVRADYDNEEAAVLSVEAVGEGQVVKFHSSPDGYGGVVERSSACRVLRAETGCWVHLNIHG